MRQLKKNEFVITGHLGKDPQMTANHSSVYFSLAYTESYNTNWLHPDKPAVWKDKTDWFQVFFGKEKFFDDVMTNLRKGDHVMVTGKLKTMVPKNSDYAQPSLNAFKIEMIKKAGQGNYNSDARNAADIAPEQKQHMESISAETQAAFDEVPF